MDTRLKQFLAAENITQSQFADKIEVSRASISHVLSGRNNPSYEFIKAIMSKYPTLNMEWLMFGKGKMYNTPQQSSRENAREDVLFNDLFAETESKPSEITDEASNHDVEEYTEIQKPEPAQPTVPFSVIKDLVESTQQPVQQRKVSKIIVLFDDGSFQEL